MYGNDPFHARFLLEIGKSQPILVLGPLLSPLRVRVYTRPLRGLSITLSAETRYTAICD